MENKSHVPNHQPVTNSMTRADVDSAPDVCQSREMCPLKITQKLMKSHSPHKKKVDTQSF